MTLNLLILANSWWICFLVKLKIQINPFVILLISLRLVFQMRMPSLNLATPKPDGVVVTARFRSPKSIQSKVCGLVFGDFIIAPGILLEPFMLPRLVEHIQQLKQGYKGGDTYIDRSTTDALRLKLPSFSATLEEAESMPCQILLVWSFGALRQAFHTELGRWRFLSKGSGDKHKAHIQDRWAQNILNFFSYIPL